MFRLFSSIQQADKLALLSMQEVLNLSKEQVQDLMFLRRVYFLRRHELEAKRTPDLKNAQQHDGKAMYGVMRMIGAAMRLQDNTLEDIHFRIRFGWAMYLGVRHSLGCLYSDFSLQQPLWSHLNCPYVNLSLCRGAIAVRMQTSCLFLHQVFSSIECPYKGN